VYSKHTAWVTIVFKKSSDPSLQPWAKLIYASQARSGFCTASDINKLDRFLARCKRHNYCDQTIPSITQQFDNADQSLFRTALYKHNHVIHRLLPPKKRQQYKLRPRNHNLVLTCRTSYYDSCNYPSNGMLARVIAIATCPSIRLVCPSVCLSRADIVSKRKNASVMISSASGSPRL